METANDINRIEMSSRSKSVARSLIRHIDLNTLKHLKRSRTILFSDKERTTTRFTLILNHTGNTYRTVKLLTDSLYPSLAIISHRHLDAESLLEELLDVITKHLNLRTLVNILITHTCVSRDRHSKRRSDILISHDVKLAKIAVKSVTKLKSLTDEDLLPQSSLGKKTLISHVVDVLD